MNDAREKIAQIIDDNYECSKHWEVTNAPQIADAILSELPSIVRGMIPDLEWGTLEQYGTGRAVGLVSHCDYLGYFQIKDGTIKRNGEVVSKGGVEVANDYRKSKLVGLLGLDT